MKFNITKHCKNRYIERVLNTGKNITSQLSEKLPRFILYIK